MDCDAQLTQVGRGNVRGNCPGGTPGEFPRENVRMPMQDYKSLHVRFTFRFSFIELVARGLKIKKLNKQWSTVQQNNAIQYKKCNAMQCNEKITINQGE